MIKLSIVTTLYRSAQTIDDFYRRASEVVTALCGDEYELVFVNDGSPDNSIDLVVALSQQDSHVSVIDLSRNFGHHNAMLAGLDYAKGEYIYLIDSDLEEEPEWLFQFMAELKKQSADVVYGVQALRKGKLFERWSGELYYWVLNWLAHVNHPRNITTARLMTRRYVRSLLLFEEREMVISFLWIITGYKQCEITVKKHMLSSTTYSFYRKMSLLVNSITSCSNFPLQLIFYIGVFIFSGSFLYVLLLILRRIIYAQNSLDGWTSIIASIWVLGGLIISAIGVLGLYLSRIYSETKQRPRYIVRQIYESIRPEHEQQL